MFLPEPAQRGVLWYEDCAHGELHARSASIDRRQEARRGRPPTARQAEWERAERARIASPPWQDRLCFALEDVLNPARTLACPDGRRIQVRHVPSRREYREWCGAEQVGEVGSVETEEGEFVLRDTN